ncbi:MAG: type IV pilin protein, partial [Methylococcales bacterium]
MDIDKVQLKSQKAFTLIELMVVVAIIGILAGIAYPAYQDSVRKSRRADAKGALLGFANAMERHFTETNSYCGAGTTTVGACLAATGAPTIYSTKSPIDGTTAYYNLTLTPSATTTVTTITQTTYNLRATPIGPQAGDGILEINNTESK